MKYLGCRREEGPERRTNTKRSSMREEAGTKQDNDTRYLELLRKRASNASGSCEVERRTTTLVQICAWHSPIICVQLTEKRRFCLPYRNVSERRSGSVRECCGRDARITRDPFRLSFNRVPIPHLFTNVVGCAKPS